MGVLFLILAIVFNSAANTLFKYASGMPEMNMQKVGIYGLGLFLGLVNTVLYLKALEQIQLSVAYPVLSAASIVIIAVLSMYVLHEGMTVQKAAGLVTICVGLLLMWKT